MTGSERGRRWSATHSGSPHSADCASRGKCYMMRTSGTGRNRKATGQRRTVTSSCGRWIDCRPRLHQRGLIPRPEGHMASDDDTPDSLGPARTLLVTALQLGTKAADAGDPAGSYQLLSCAARLARKVKGLGEV